MIEQKFKELCDSIPVPDSLTPEQMEQRLREHKLEKHKQIHGFQKTFMVAAACFLVLVISGSFLWQIGIIAPTTTDIAQITTSDNATLGYDDYYEIIDNYYGEKNDTSVWDLLVPEKEESAVTSGMASDDFTSTSQSNNYTKTNSQVSGVDEGDIVKTDGTYIYGYTEDAIGTTLKITKAAGRDSQNVSSFTIEQFSLYEFYVDTGRLTAIGRDWNIEKEKRTAIVVYDISDVTNPVLIEKRTQSGNYETSRKNGDYVYTISAMYVDNNYKRSKRETYIPCTDNTLISEINLYRPKDFSSDMYLVVTALDVTKPESFSDRLATLSDGGIYYVSEKNIYMVSPSSDSSNSNIISKFSYQDGQLDRTCETIVRAEILNQFSLDESNGHLRFVGTTNHFSGSTSSGLYILDEELNPVGSVSNLAAGERIYSSRFMGDYAYFVTYRETDPLFAVDMSNPKNPVVTDALKIPGFSEYLHPYGDGLLLGIGQDVSDGNDRVKLSMFDISSPTNLKELCTHKLEENSYSQAASNHKAMLVDPERNIIGLAIDSYSKETRYELYRYTEEGFECLASLLPSGINYESTRGLFIGDYFYLVDGDGAYGIYVYDAKTLENVGKVLY